jgi:hypothetical protein
MLKIAALLLASLIAVPAFATDEPLSRDECKALKREIKALYNEEKSACSAIRDRDDKRECKEDARDRRNDALDDLKAVCG